MVKQIKKNIELAYIDEYFKELKVSKYADVIVYGTEWYPVLHIQIESKLICIIKYLPKIIYNSELLDDYLKKFTTFADYNIKRW